jgi:hypothetical protein
MAPAAGFWRRGAHDVSLARLYALRAAALFFAIDGLFSKLPVVIRPDPASRGIVASLLAALWVSAFFTFRYPLRMMPLFLFELVWKTLWLIDYGAPQYLAGTGSPRLARDLFEIGFFPLPIALIIPWGHVWRRYVRAPAEPWRRPARAASAARDPEVSLARRNLVRAAFLIAGVAGCALALPAILRPDPIARGMLESMIAGLWVSALIGLRHPLLMLPILLFAFVAATLWLIDFGLPSIWAGPAATQSPADLLAIGGAALLSGVAIPWAWIWRNFIRRKAERWH